MEFQFSFLWLIPRFYQDFVSCKNESLELQEESLELQEESLEVQEESLEVQEESLEVQEESLEVQDIHQFTRLSVLKNLYFYWDIRIFHVKAELHRF